MTIDLRKFSKPKEVTVPIIEKRGVYGGRKFTLNKEDGIYQVLLGDEVMFKAVPAGIEKEEVLNTLPIIRGISYGDKIVPLNFSNTKFLGYEETIPVYFMNADLGLVVKTRRWEDGTLLFHEVDYGFEDQLLVIGIKERAEKRQPLTDVKGITPEMRYFYLLLSLDLQRIEEWKDLDKLALSRSERDKRIEEFRESFAGRLQKTITDAGGSLVRYSRRGDRVDVVWKVGNEEFHSTIKQDFRILELGFCADGYDKDHSIASAILLAKDFVDRGVIYKTRE